MPPGGRNCASAFFELPEAERPTAIPAEDCTYRSGELNRGDL
jgi:hypothetical protein